MRHRERRPVLPRRHKRRGFTLIELLVVITIIILVSAATIPAILPALNHRQVSEAARILQAALVGAHDAAIRANEPRGIRLLPDITLTQPSFAQPGAVPPGALSLAYSRFVPIQPAPEYNDGLAAVRIIGDPVHPIVATTSPVPFPPPYPHPTGGFYPFQTVLPAGPVVSNVLMVEESPYFLDSDPTQGFNSPTSWFWNIRVGDQIRLEASGRYYTVVGPMGVTPIADYATGSTLRNPEMFVNVGPPGTISPLSRGYVSTNGNANPPIEFLFLVNGQDDNNNGLVDEGWNGLDDWTNGTNPTATGLFTGPGYFVSGPILPPDELSEWEVETWLGGESRQGLVNQTYTIFRRPVVMPGAREINLPSKIVIDATTWNTTEERSRLSIDPNTLYADILISPSGQVLPSTPYSNSFNVNSGAPFYHFWLTEREGVHATNELVSSGTPYPFVLPLPAETYTNLKLSPVPSLALTGERRLLTLFTRNGLLLNNAIESSTAAAADAFLSNGIYNVNAPFIYAESGGRGEVD